MRTNLTIIVLAVAAMTSAPAWAQNISVTSAQGQNVNTFVQQHLVGPGVLVTNVKFNNVGGVLAGNRLGTFQSNGYTGLSMSDGVVMTTGNVSVAVGPNNSGNASDADPGAFYADNQLTSYASGNIINCASLDFDFVSTSSTVSVLYCFGSEEYPEYVCSSYNDVFAFLVTGPDPATGETRTWNAAVIPGTVSQTNPNGIAVAINSVNGGSSGGYSSGTNCYYNYSNFYINNPWGAQGVQYDGMTIKLSASTVVVPCEQYHMHISICNVGDNFYDSGVFLQSNSFRNAENSGIALPHTDTDTIAPGASVYFSLLGSQYVMAQAVVGMGGTAVPGVDFTATLQNGAILNPGDTIDATIPGARIFIDALPGASFPEPVTAEVYLATEMCENFPDLKVYDTLRVVLLGESSGVEEAETSLLRVYPNPASADITVEADGLEAVTLVNAQGQVVYSAPADGPRHHIATASLPAGGYTLVASLPQGPVSRKVIIRR